MRNLIIPCVGRNLINNKMLYLTEHPKGGLLIKRTFEGMDTDLFDRIIITILKEDVDKWDSVAIIKNSLDTYLNTYEFCVLDEMTSGPAETVYETIVQMDLKGSLVVKDVDNSILVDADKIIGDFIVGLNVYEYEKDITNLKSNSFLIANEQSHILDIVEKELKSNDICLGMYGFNQIHEYIFAYERLSSKYSRISNIYISQIITYLIGREGVIYKYVKAKEFENWSAIIDWKSLERQYATYFVDRKVLFDKEWDEDNIAKINILLNSGADIILYTAESSSDGKWNTELEQKGILVNDIIYNCAGRIKDIVDDSNKLNAIISE